MSEHLPRHLLEAYSADASRLPNTSELRGHLAGCERCSARLREIESARAAFLQDHPANEFARRVIAATKPGVMTPRRSRLLVGRSAASGALVLAAAASLLLLRDPSEPAIRSRGANVAMQAYVQSGAGVHVLREGEVLSGGTQLAFTYTLYEPRHLLLLGIDDAGTITRYFPDGKIVQSSALRAGSKRQLPVGIELDARRGRERLIALFSAGPISEDSARAALEASWREARARGRDIAEPFELALPAQQISLWFDKR